MSASARAAKTSLPTSCCPRCAISLAVTWRNRRHRKGVQMAVSRSDALVVFGCTGDLAHKQIFPALYAMVKSGELTVPVVGVAFPNWSLERLQRRVTDSVKRAGGIDNQRAL